MAHWRITGLLLGIATALAGASSQAEGLRCGDKLASTGSSRYEVHATCGDPDDAQHSVETRVVERRVVVPCPVGSQRGLCEIVVADTIEVDVDRWSYDFGSNRFIEFVRFEQGVLVHVTDGP